MVVCSMIAVLCTLGCSQSDVPGTAEVTGQQDSSSVTLTNLVHVDAVTTGYQHPLVCGSGGDFPAGQELVFRHTESDDFIHVVFPEEMETPDEHLGNFVLHGYFQGIQNRSRYMGKIPPADYTYFVVRSWEYCN